MFVTRNVSMKYRNPADGNGNDLPGDNAGQGQGAGEGGDGNDQGQQGDGQQGEGQQGEGEKRKPTDEEARLIKENMKRKAENKALKEQLETLQQSVAGLNLDEVRQILAERKSAEEKQLEAKGDYERLKQRMAEEHQATVTSLNAKIDELTKALQEKEAVIGDLTVGAQFNSSQYINGELVLTPAKARALYGAHFEIEDGKVVGYDKPRGAAGRTALVDAYGVPVSFDAAMAKIIEADPEKDSLIRSKAKAGAGSNTKPTTKVPDSAQGAPAVNRIAAGLKSLGIK